MKAADLSGALLAGGLSRRMGRDKCLLEIDGAPLWRRQWNLLGSLADSVSVIAPLRPAWCGEGMSWIADEPPGSGPLGGLAAALAHAARPKVLVLAVDLPEMTVEYLCSLEKNATEQCGIVPELDGWFQPLSAIYPKAVLPAVRSHLAGEDKSLQQLLRELVGNGQMRALPVVEGERPLFRNLNTPQD
jgi:molybdopterin-guanine dinucleotide biosynthesis protein A